MEGQIVLFTVMLILPAFEAYDVDLSSVHFEGGFALFPVKRDKVQIRLEEFNCQVANDDVKLFLPVDPVLQHTIASDEHVVMVVFGSVGAVTFDEALNDEEKMSVSTVATKLAIVIPYLSSREKGESTVTLQMTTFKQDGDIIEANAILPKPIIANNVSHKIEGSNIEIDVQKDDLQMNLTGNYTKQCTFSEDHVFDDVNEYEHEFQISESGANFEICDRYPDLEVDFCDVYRNPTYGEILSGAGSNVCQYWKPTKNVRSFNASFSIASMSDQMRPLLLLEDQSRIYGSVEDDTQDAIEAEIQTGNYNIRLVFPCFE